MAAVSDKRRCAPLDELPAEEQERVRQALAEERAKLPEPVVVTVKAYGRDPRDCEFEFLLPGSPGSLHMRPAIVAAIQLLQEEVARWPDSGSERVEALSPDEQRRVEKIRSGDVNAVAEVVQELAAREEELNPADRRMLKVARRLLSSHDERG